VRKRLITLALTVVPVEREGVVGDRSIVSSSLRICLGIATGSQVSNIRKGTEGGSLFTWKDSRAH